MKVAFALSLVFIVQIGLGFSAPEGGLRTLKGVYGTGSITPKAVTELEWWQETVVYQVYPRSFMDSDGDGTGDINGITSKMDYFVELGVKAVWISPIYKSPMVDFGYDISNFTDIDPLFGTLDDFKRMSAEFQKRDIKIVMDFVPNHTSDLHPWFEKSVNSEGKFTDFFVWKNASSFDAQGNPKPPNNWVSVFGGSMWEWNDKRRQYYLHQFTKEQPDLNFENNEVWIEILAAVKFWLNLGVSGFRVDAVPHLFEDQRFLDEPLSENVPPGTIPTEHWQLQHIYSMNQPKVFDLLAEMRLLLDIYEAVDGEVRCMMVEAAISSEFLEPYYGDENRPIAHFPFNFNMLGVKPETGAEEVRWLLDRWKNLFKPDKWLNMLMGNHDNARVTKRFTTKGVDAANMLNLLVKATSVTYNGEEIGMDNRNLTWEETRDPAGCNMGPDRYAEFSRDPARTPMQWDDTTNAGFSTADKTWLPLHQNYMTINVKAENEAEESHLKVYKELVKMRSEEAWRSGKHSSFVLNDNKVLGFTRLLAQGVEGSYVVVVNFSDAALVVDLTTVAGVPDTAKVRVRSVGTWPVGYKPNDDISTNAIPLGERSSIVLTFASDASP